MRQISISKLLICIILIGFGWVLGQYFENFSLFTYSYEISLMDAITLLGTALMAWYVARVLEKNIQDKRLEKDLILNKIDEVDQAINALINLNSSGDEIAYVKVVHLLQKSRKWSSRFWSIIDKKYKPLYKKEKNRYDDMMVKIRQVNRLCTYTSPAGNDQDIRILDGIITYSDNRKYELDSKLESIRDDLLEFKLEVNLQ